MENFHWTFEERKCLVDKQDFLERLAKIIKNKNREHRKKFWWALRHNFSWLNDMTNGWENLINLIIYVLRKWI